MNDTLQDSSTHHYFQESPKVLIHLKTGKPKVCKLYFCHHTTGHASKEKKSFCSELQHLRWIFSEKYPINLSVLVEGFLQLLPSAALSQRCRLRVSELFLCLNNQSRFILFSVLSVAQSSSLRNTRDLLSLHKKNPGLLILLEPFLLWILPYLWKCCIPLYHTSSDLTACVPRQKMNGITFFVMQLIFGAEF